MAADRNPDAALMAPHGTPQRHRQIAWLNFIASELHRMYSPWLFHPEYGEQPAVVARHRIADRLAHVERALATAGPFLGGDVFAAPDAYLFTVVGWSGAVGIDLGPYPALRAFTGRVGERPAVRRAVHAEGIQVADA